VTDIEVKALALVNEIEREEGATELTPHIMRALIMDEALCRAIEQHEAFKQDVSDAVQSWVDGGIDTSSYLWFRKKLEQFIIPKPKPDPLVEAIGEAMQKHEVYSKYELTDSLRAALEARGLEIREKNGA
jgi:hypothetical protein